MPKRNDLLVGQIALELGLVTQEQLQGVIREQARQEQPRPLGVLLVAKGYLADNQLVRILDEHARRVNEEPLYGDRRKQDMILGKLLAAQGRCTEEQVHAALARQQELAEEGTIKRVGEILVELGHLTLKQVHDTLGEQEKTRTPRPLKLPADPSTANVTPENLSSSVTEALEDPAKIFGKFVLLKQIGAGGFGTVWRAYQRDLARHVALKFLHSDSPEDVPRFVREAQTAARLSHPHIVPIFEVGEHEGKHYISMEFIDGQTLNRLRVDARRAAEVMVDVARAVQSAHGRGIIHRDLKPHNLMMGATGHVWVMDFGLARQIQGGTTLTQSGAIMGTPAYMPPEQAEGRPCDERSDVYSLGATLYELLSGHAPFEGATPLDVLRKVTDTDAAPLGHAPADLATIVARAMEKEPSRRFEKAADFADDLNRWLDGEPIRAVPPSGVTRAVKWVKRHRALSAALALALAVAGYFLGPASVTIHGRRSMKWPAGRHRLEWAEPDYDPQAAWLTLVPWRTVEWNPPKVPDHGWVRVESDPPGAEVIIDGRPAGKAGPFKVLKGTRAIALRLADHEELTLPIVVAAGETVPLKAALKHEVGYLRVTTATEGASMTVTRPDRTAVGTYALPARLELPTGTYRLRFDKENHWPRETEVVIRKAPGPKALLPPDNLPLDMKFDKVRAGDILTLIGRMLGVTFEFHESDASAIVDYSVRGVPWREALAQFLVRAKLVVDRIDFDGAGVRMTVSRPSEAVMGAGLLFRASPFETLAHATLNPRQMWSFESRGPVTTRSAIADLDGDGVPDCVVGSEDSRIYALSGRDGSKLWEFKTGGAIRSSPALADLDRDGTPDCVVGSLDSRVYALSGRDGSNLWEFKTGRSVESSPALADLDRDGVPDCVVGSDDSRVYALSGRDGSKLWEFTTGMSVRSSPALADLDRDGIPDCVVGSHDSGVYALSGRDGSRLWAFKTGTWVTSSPALADLDRDGTPDCVVGSNDCKIYALSGRDGSKLWESETASSVTSSPALADLDRDGTPDCIVGSQDSRVYALSGRDGSRLWVFNAGTAVHSSPALTDLDRDGIPDCVVGSYDSKVHALSGRDGSKLWEFKTGSSVESSPALADLDRDGTAECVVGSRDSRVYALSGRDGSMMWELKTGGGVASSPALPDLDRDGTPDCVVGSRDSRAYALSGRDGSKLWEFKTGSSVESSPALADLDRDGIPDCVVGSVDAKVYALSGRDGSKLWEFKAESSTESSPALSDLDRDGTPDGVLGSWDTRVYALSGRDGSRLWDFKTGGFVQSSPALADLNRDGIPDCVVGSFDSKVYALSGRDGSKLWEFRTGDLVWSSPALADLDRDGVPDCVVGSFDSKVYALSGRDGSKLWEFKTGGAIDSSPALADLDRDGTPDCVVGSDDFKVYALSGRDGSKLWEFKTGNAVKSSPALADLDNDGGLECAIASGSRLYVLRAEDGELLAEFAGTGRPALTRGRLLVADGWSVKSYEYRRGPPVPIGALVRHETWRAVLRRPDAPPHARGLAKLRLGDTKGAIDDFREAAKLGLRSPELHADWLEACAKLRVPMDLPEIHPGAAALVLAPRRLNHLERLLVADGVKGDAPHHLILQTKYDEALSALPKGDTWDWQALSLRALAKREKGDIEGAKKDLDIAIKLNPWNRDLKREFEETGARK